MKKDAFLIGFFLGAGLVLGSKVSEKLISYAPAGMNYLKGKISDKKKKSDDEFEEVK